MFTFKTIKEQMIKGIQFVEYSMKNEFLEVRFLNVGGVITKIAMAEDEFNENLVLAYENYENYLTNDCYLGALVGRTSNRIKNGTFTINEKTFTVDLNDGPNNLHGGKENLSHTVFNVNQLQNGYLLSTTLPHQPHGFPGNLEINVSYLLNGNKLVISYEASSDQDTLVNLTQHTYFNLSGNLKHSIYNHELQISADTVAEVDENSSFTELELPVKHNLFDFTQRREINPDGMERLPLFEKTSGYDHLYHLTNPQSAAIFKDPISGRTLKISTTEPTMQFYAGNYLTSDITFENGRQGESHLGACFETHLVPYDFESQILKASEVYQQKTSFEFSR